ncbi:poly(A) polymerase small subunit PAPS [Turkeypox virus]|uniref:Cap-specific mRNA (nucleoside-2'-O-)-methyltransferase n=1 Tax=Turkeypox virus TaxID=336486 RepID=A0A0M5HVG2_9POXV|nr:poly(A) polymerase small subunit PAPS [Turkeypox virus]ALA62471.1 poly(A) polymerase small subunit PAPS [Turkeypox virus]
MNILDAERPFMFYNELTCKQDYNKNIESSCKNKFPCQGQLKLLIGEIYFLNRLIKEDILCSNTVIIYIGSAPGNHIKFLHNYLNSINIYPKWILIDGRDHEASLEGLKDVTIVQRFVDEPYLFKLRNITKKDKVVLISDIRSLRGKEPTTEDLLHDYALQNMMISILAPVASSLKWRCPFPEQWLDDFYIPYGEEFLQPFAPTFSAEMRILGIYVKAPIRLLRINKDIALEYEKKMFYLNNIIRRSIVLDFDYPIQDYDFFHMFHILKDIVIPESLQFLTDKQKVIFLQDSIFKSLNIRK